MQYFLVTNTSPTSKLNDFVMLADSLTGGITAIHKELARLGETASNAKIEVFNTHKQLKANLTSNYVRLLSDKN